jgi:hypothetical protein
MAFTINDVPYDVQFVWALNIAGKPVGKATIDKCKAIMDKYPEWFETYKGEELPRKIKPGNK